MLTKMRGSAIAGEPSRDATRAPALLLAEEGRPRFAAYQPSESWPWAPAPLAALLVPWSAFALWSALEPWSVGVWVSTTTWLSIPCVQLPPEDRLGSTCTSTALTQLLPPCPPLGAVSPKMTRSAPPE